MRDAWLRAAIAAGLVSSPTFAQPQTFYVAPNGNDSQSGTTAGEAFATLAKARDAIRAAKPSHDGDFQVVIADGEYPLDAAFELTAADSAPAGHTITYKAGAAGIPSVLFSGGVLVPAGWQHQFAPGGTVWRLSLPTTSDWAFRDLYYRNARCPRSRWPTPTTNSVGSNAVIEQAFEDQRGFILDRPLPRFALWPQARIEAVGRHTWVQPRQFIDIASCTERAFTCAAPLGAPPGEYIALTKGDKIHFENSPALINVPYEWALIPRTDSGPAELFILLPPGISPASNLTAPRTQTLLSMNGCSGIRFEGVCFAFSSAPFPSMGVSGTRPQQFLPGYDPGQSGHDRVTRDNVLPAAIEMTGVTDCSLTRSRVAHTGGNGIMAQGSRITIEECEIFDTGGTAVYIGPFGLTWSHHPSSPEATLRDCWIHDFGQVYQDCAAVWAAWSPRLTIRDNQIARGGYSGISAGWVWGHAAVSAPGDCPHYDAPAIMEGTVIVQNDIHDVMREEVDGGAIYMLGSQGGAVSAQLRGNWIHDIERNPTWRYGACTGLYFDEGSDGWTVADNVVERANRLIEFNTFSRDGLPNPCSGCVSPCTGLNPYGKAAWHSEFRSDNGHIWPGQTWPEDRWNYFDRDPTRITAGFGATGLPRAWVMTAKGEPLQVRAIRNHAGTHSEFVFAHCPAVHPTGVTH